MSRGSKNLLTIVLKYPLPMSGHSKWATIHRQKEVSDAKKGQAWTKVANAIVVAVRSGGGITDPEKNFRLRLAIEKGRSLNMPKENTEKAITRASGESEGGVFEEVVYEGFGPSGVAIMVEAATDNKNRTSQEIKNIFERGGGSLASRGAVSFQFSSKGFIILVKPEKPEEAMLKIMDIGVDDIEEVEDGIEVYTNPEELELVKQKLQAEGFQVKNYELTMKPVVNVPVIDKENAIKILDLMEKLEGQADVQRVFANFDIPEALVS